MLTRANFSKIITTHLKKNFNQWLCCWKLQSFQSFESFQKSSQLTLKKKKNSISGCAAESFRIRNSQTIKMRPRVYKTKKSLKLPNWKKIDKKFFWICATKFFRLEKNFSPPTFSTFNINNYSIISYDCQKTSLIHVLIRYWLSTANQNAYKNDFIRRMTSLLRPRFSLWLSTANQDAYKNDVIRSSFLSRHVRFIETSN